jgi:hypothetical protein
MNTPEGENAPLLRAPPRRPSYAAPSSVRNGVAATLVAGCVVATLAVSGRLGREPARVERAATAVSSTEAPREAKMGVAPGVDPVELGNFFTDAWDSTVGELVPSMSFAEPAPAPEGPLDADAEGDPSREAEAPGSDFYPGVAGCEATCESDDVATQEDCDAIGPFCEWGEGKCWSAVGPDPCPTDWGEAEGAEAPGPGADDPDAPSPPEKKTKKKKKEKTKKDDADAPAPAYDDADDEADAPAPAYDDAEAPAPAAEIDLLGELETVYGDKTNDDAKKREKFDALDDELNHTRRHTKDSEDDLSPAQKLKRIKKAIERGPEKKASGDEDATKTSKTSTKTSRADAHPTGSITPPKIPALFEAEVFRGDLAEGVSDDVLAQIVRTKMADNKYEGLFEDLEVKRFEFRVSFDVTVAGSRCPKVSDDAFAEGVKAFVKQARADDAIARFGEDKRTPLQKVTERNREPTRAEKREVHDDLDGVLRSMAVGACENVARAELPAVADDSAEKEEKDAKPTESSSSSSALNAAHKFRVDLVIPRAGPETNAAEMTDRVGGLFDVAHVKKQLEAAHVSKAREDATDVSIDDVTVHGKISVAEKAKR